MTKAEQVKNMQDGADLDIRVLVISLDLIEDWEGTRNVSQSSEMLDG